MSAQAAVAHILDPVLRSFRLLPGPVHDGKDEKNDEKVVGEVTARQLATEEALEKIAQRCGHFARALFPANPSDFLSFFANEDHYIHDGKEESKLQKLLTKAAEKQLFLHIKDRDEESRRRFIRSRVVANSHHWKNVVGSSWQLRLDNEAMAACVRVEYGLQAAPQEIMTEQCGLCNKHNLARDAAHFLTCQKTRADEIIKRHNQVCQAFATACRALGHHVRVEPKRLDKEDAKRVDLDITMQLKQVLADVTIRCSATKNPDQVLDEANRQKTKKYQDKACALGCEFVPLAFDAFGGWHNVTDKLIERIKRTGQPRDSCVTAAGVVRALRQEISVAIHRFNGKALARGARHSRRHLDLVADVDGCLGGLGLGLGA